jgi:hypothetical protein
MASTGSGEFAEVLTMEYDHRGGLGVKVGRLLE